MFGRDWSTSELAQIYVVIRWAHPTRVSPFMQLSLRD